MDIWGKSKESPVNWVIRHTQTNNPVNVQYLPRKDSTGWRLRFGRVTKWPRSAPYFVVTIRLDSLFSALTFPPNTGSTSVGKVIISNTIMFMEKNWLVRGSSGESFGLLGSRPSSVQWTAGDCIMWLRTQEVAVSSTPAMVNDSFAYKWRFFILAMKE